MSTTSDTRPPSRLGQIIAIAAISTAVVGFAPGIIKDAGNIIKDAARNKLLSNVENCGASVKEKFEKAALRASDNPKPIVVKALSWSTSCKLEQGEYGGVTFSYKDSFAVMQEDVNSDGTNYSLSYPLDSGGYESLINQSLRTVESAPISAFQRAVLPVVREAAQSLPTKTPTSPSGLSGKLSSSF